MKRLRCLIVDDQPVVRVGVMGVLDERFQVEEASGLSEALDVHTDTGGFDVAVLDLDRRLVPDGEPQGTALVRAIRRNMPGTGIVAHASRAERLAVAEAIDAGASAFVAKSSPLEALRDAIEAAADAGRFIDPRATDGDGRGPLTRRQRQILQLLADGLSTDAAANQLGLSAETVRTHAKATLGRLGARDRVHAVAIGLRSGVID